MNVVPPCLPNMKGLVEKLDRIAIQFSFVAWKESAFSHLELVEDSLVEDATQLEFVRLSELVLVLVPVKPLSLPHSYKVWQELT